MKKGLFILLALAMMTFACQPASNDNGNANSGNKNMSPGIYTDPQMIPVTINLAYKRNSDIYHFEVTPPSVTIASGTQQIQWIISNNSDYVLSDVKVYNFKGQKTGNTDPFRNGGAFGYNAIAGRNVDASKLSGTSDTIDTFEYEVTGILTMGDGSKVTIKLDPRVVISGN